MVEPLIITRTARRPRVQIGFAKTGRTKQSMAADCDINRIMARFKTSGQLPATNPIPPQMGDFSQSLTFHEAQNQVRTAEAAFFDLPSKIRTRFRNNPAEMLIFLADEKNRDEAESMGLLQAKPQAKPVPTSKPKAPEVASPPPETGGETPQD